MSLTHFIKIKQAIQKEREIILTPWHQHVPPMPHT